MVRMNGLLEWAGWRRRGEWRGPFGVICGEIVTRAGHRVPAPRPRRLGKLRLMLARLWPVRVHSATDSNVAEAGDGPPPVRAGWPARDSGRRQPFPARTRL